MNTYEKAQEVLDNIENLEQIEVTSGTNGYPQNLKAAVIGFETFESAESIAQQYNATVCSFRRRDGWSFWENKGKFHGYYYMMEVRDQGSNTRSLNPDDYMSEADYIEQEVAPDIDSDCVDSFDTLQKMINHHKAVWEALENCEDDEFVWVEDAEVHTEKCDSMSFTEDVWHYAIGIMFNPE